MEVKQWHQLRLKEVISGWESHLSEGLKKELAKKRLLEMGPNRLKEKPKRPFILTVLDQFKSIIVIILLVAAVIAIITANIENPPGMPFYLKYSDSFTILLIVILNAVLGVVQNLKAESAIESLKKLSIPMVKVIRDGILQVISSEEIVPGDLIELEEGDHIPADIRLIEVSRFATDESSLTGESITILKETKDGLLKETPLADRVNMAFMGTSVASGRAKGIVVTTGMNTELGKIAGLIESIEKEKTPLEQKLDLFGKYIAYLCVALGIIILVLGLIRGHENMDFKQLFLLYALTGISLAVAVIPEGLPAITTIIMAIGTKRMALRNAIIRKLASVETLGCTTIICTDKTGTLTENKMSLRKAFADNRWYELEGEGYSLLGKIKEMQGAKEIEVLHIEDEHPGLYQTLLAGTIANNAKVEKKGEKYVVVGDPTEISIVVASRKALINVDHYLAHLEFATEIPFDSNRKMMSKIFQKEDQCFLFAKGAAENILERCQKIALNNQIQDLTPEIVSSMLQKTEEMATSALRVLGIAKREFGKAYLEDQLKKNDYDGLESQLIFLGLVGIIDPPRVEVKASIQKIQKAGISSVMITGDHKATAMAIGQMLGIVKEDTIAVSGTEIDHYSDAELAEICPRVSVFARVTAEHKLRIVKAYKSNQQIVAMTGDGINDAPAIKEASIGVAMGISGTDVTKSTADLVLADDNYSTIVAAIEEGRIIYTNIKKFIYFLLSSNMGIVFCLFLNIIFGWPLPLLPLQILWINLITNGLPALALGVDQPEPDLMEKPPRSPKEKILGPWEFKMILINGTIMGLIATAIFAIEYFLLVDPNRTAAVELANARTMTFTFLAFAPMLHSLNCRSNIHSIFKLGLFTNLPLVGAAAVAVVLQLVAIYFKPLQVAFKTEAINLTQWIVVLALCTTPLLFMEIYKYFVRRKMPG